MRFLSQLSPIKANVCPRCILVAVLGISAALAPASDAAIVLIDNSGITASASSEFGSSSSTSSRAAEKAINGDGLSLKTPGSDPNDPTNWQSISGINYSGEGYNWLARSISAWLIIDLAQVYRLSQLSFFNFNPNSSTLNERGVRTANIYYVNDDTNDSPNGNNTYHNGAAFDSGGWTQLGGGPFTFTEAPNTGPQTTPDTIDFTGIDTQYIAFEILTNYGDSSYVGIGELQLFTVPEPASAFGAVGLSLLALLGRRKRLIGPTISPPLA